LRVVGLSGEVWEERRGVVHINGEPLFEPYLRANRRDRRTLSTRDVPPRGTLRRIRAKMYLLMGDNRALVCDSRLQGLAKFKPNTWGKLVLIGDTQGRPTGVPPRGYRPPPKR
jgi:Signal peptidase, peptidase S26